jgi:hypothetical protein
MQAYSRKILMAVTLDVKICVRDDDAALNKETIDVFHLQGTDTKHRRNTDLLIPVQIQFRQLR